MVKVVEVVKVAEKGKWDEFISFVSGRQLADARGALGFGAEPEVQLRFG